MIKQCFTDSLISLAIVLSLLRTDVSNYFSSNYISYPEVQEIILGGSTAYARVNNYIDNTRNHLLRREQHVHFKNVDYGHVFSASFFNELRRLTSNPFSYNYDDLFPLHTDDRQRRGRRRRQRVRYPGLSTDFSTYLVSAEQASTSSLVSENPTENSSGNNNNNNNNGGSDDSNYLIINPSNSDSDGDHQHDTSFQHASVEEEDDDNGDEEEGEQSDQTVEPPSEEVDYFNRINSYIHSEGKREQAAARPATDPTDGVSHPTYENGNLCRSNDSDHNPHSNNNNININDTVANMSSVEAYLDRNVTSCTDQEDSSDGGHTISSTDPTNEDLDLIDVLYLQDIDLGVQREVYDVTLRRDLEREQEVALQKEREKQKEYELVQLKLEEEQRRIDQQYLCENYTQDIETGEWIPLYQPAPNTVNFLEQQQQQQSPPPPPPPPPHIPQPISQYQADLIQNNSCQYQSSNILNSTLEEALQSLDIDASKNITNELEQYLATCPVTNFINEPYQPILSPQFDCDLLPCHNSTVTDHNNDLHSNYTESSHTVLASCERQNSLDNWWREISGSLEMTTANSSDNPTHCPQLIQNATLPIPSGDISCGNNFNTSLNATTIPTTTIPTTTTNLSTPTTPAEWDSQSYLFPNISGVSHLNDSETMMDVEKMLPSLQRSIIDLPAITEDLVSFDEASRDSAVCSLASSASPLQDFSELSSCEQLEGATGGSDYDSCSSGCKSIKQEPTSYYCSYDPIPYGQHTIKLNQSTSSNDTDFNYQPTSTNHILHNHTYPQHPHNISYEVPSIGHSSSSSSSSNCSSSSSSKAYSSSAASSSYHRGPTSRDHKRLQELKVPLSMSQIINSSVEEFNDLVRKYPLPESHLRLIRDIRRRGKNKVAAQNCRKRKLDVIGTLEEEVIQMRRERDRLLREGNLIHKQTTEMKEKYNVRYHEVFASLRNESGNQYDPQEYSLQQSSDGNVFLVRKTVASDDKTLDSNRKKKSDKK